MLLRSLYDCEAPLQWVGHLGNIFKTIFDRNGFNVSHSPSHQPVRTLYTWYTSYPVMRKYLSISGDTANHEGKEIFFSSSNLSWLCEERCGGEMKEWGMCFLYNYPCILFLEWQWYKHTLDPAKAHSWYNPIFHFRHHHHCHRHQHTGAKMTKSNIDPGTEKVRNWFFENDPRSHLLCEGQV